MSQSVVDSRMDRLVDTVVALASGRLDARLEPSDAGDEIDAVATGINMLAEELQVTYADLERRVRDRTAALEQATEELRRMVLHDPLTDLPNRRLLQDRVEHALVHSQRPGRTVALLFIDLDRFKAVNDSLGHHVGDQLLIQVARELRRSVRPGDTIARLGGDEFVILCEDLADQAASMAVAARVLEALNEPFLLAGQEVLASASVGIASSSDGQTAPAALLSQADAAMYAAKKLGGGRAMIFEPHMSAGITDRHQLETALRHGIANGQIRVLYQPIVEIRTGRVTEMEALARWQHPERGLLPPGAFLDLAEETGLVVPLGRTVLRQACADTALLRRQGGNPALRVAVNLSARELAQDDLVSTVVDALAAADLPADALCLELTETGLISATEDTLDRLRQLKALGITLAIDDFGTGYSSLTYLKRFPIDVIKTDQSFVHDLCSSDDDAAIVAAVIGLGQALGLRSVAEGVETPQQLTALSRLGCDLAQGYHYSRPVSVDNIGAMLSGKFASLVPGTDRNAS